MDKKTVFVKTDKGENEVSGQGDVLYGDAKRILHLVDDESTVGDITRRAPPSLRDVLQTVLQELVDGGYIRDMRAPVNVPQKPTLKFATPSLKMASPKNETPTSAKPAPASVSPAASTPKVTIPPQANTNAATPSMSMPDMTMPAMPPAELKKEEQSKSNKNTDLDFSFITSGSGQSGGQAAVVKDNAQAEALARARQAADDAARLKAAQTAQIEATAKAAKLKAYEEAKERAKIDVTARARIEAESRLKQEAEAARRKAEQEALKARTELDATKSRVEAEVRARIEAEARVKREVEAAKAKVEAEMRSRIEAEARAKAEAEARVKREAEAERLRIEKERAELELARIKAETEIKLRAEAELRVRAEVEARLKREAEAERFRIEKERAALELARVKAEAEIKMRTEAELRVRAEVEARLQAEALAQAAARLSPRPDTPGNIANPVPVKEEQVDPSEKLRKSFVESFSQGKGQPKASPSNFELDNFSFVNTGNIAALTVEPKKPEALPGAGTKVKAAIEERARKEAEAQRLKAEQAAALLKAEQDEAARIKSQKDAAAARVKAEQDLARFTAEQEAYRLKVEEDEKSRKAEVEAQRLTDHQAKQWEEAQHRAANQAQKEKEQLARQAAEAQAKSQPKSARKPRKPLPIGKMLAGIFVLALLAVAGLPYIWPLDGYIAPLENEISAQLNQPVHIKKIHLALVPLPKLELHTLSVGKGQELSVGDAILHFDFSALFSPTRSINNMELTNVNLGGASLDNILVWMQAIGASEKYPVSRMELRGVRVNSDEIKLPALNGKAYFDMQGKFTKADLKSEDGKLGLELQSIQNRLQLELNIHEGSLPVLPDIKFNDLSASGVVENGEFVFADFFAHIHGGTLTGKGQLNWNNGWKLQGQLNAKSLELKRVFPNYGVTGELFGDVKVSMHGATLSQLNKEPLLEGTFEARNGVVNKLDIDTVARIGSRKGVAGHTDFTEVSGTIKSDKQGQRLYLGKISAGSVSGTGLLEVDEKQELTGSLLVDIKGLAKVSVPLQVSGSLTEPLLQPGR